METMFTRIKSAPLTCKQNDAMCTVYQNSTKKLTDIPNFTGNFLYLCQRF